MKGKSIQFMLAFVCLVLGVMLASQFKSVKINAGSSLEFKRATDLMDELMILRQKYDDVYEALQKTQDKVKEYQDASAQSSKVVEIIQKDLQEANILAGLLSVQGEGVEVTLDDSKARTQSAEYLNPNDFILHDGDVLLVVNELRDAGAEALSINGQRLLATSEIRCAGSVISINNTKIGAPFIIKAIGNAEYLESALKLRDGVVDTLKQYGIEVAIKKMVNVTIPKYTGALNFRYACPAEEKDGIQ